MHSSFGPATARPRRYVPRFDHLEDRCVPVVSVVQVGNVITLTGNNSNESIIITDNGTNLAGGITVGGAAVGQVSSLPVGGALPIVIVINMGGGNDNVRYNLTGGVNTASASGGRSVSGNLSAGNDTFRFAAIHDAFNSGGPGAAFPMAIAGGATVAVSMVGGPGNDTIGMRYLGILGAVFGADAGNLSFNAIGGAGNDNVFVSVSVPIALGPGATVGSVSTNVSGGAGNDNLGLIQDLPSSGAILTVVPPTLTGGGGTDIAFVTLGVVATGVETLIPL